MASNTKTRKGVSRTQGVVFIGIFLALILKTTLDTFFKGLAGYDTLLAVELAVRRQPVKSALVCGQLCVFLFSLIRFYWGSFRYYQQKPKVEETPELAVDLLGAIVLFMSFYVVSLLVRTTTLFYYGILLVHAVDLAWFLLATTYLTLDEGIRKVAGLYILFDIVTVISVAILTVANAIWGPTHLLVFQFLSLIVVCLIGLWDLKKLWPYYTDEPDWQDSLPRKQR
jgi:hypothetical protein